MNELTGKDKAIAQALLSAGFEIGEFDKEYGYAHYWADVPRSSYFPFLNWVVAPAAYDPCIQVKERASQITFTAPYQAEWTSEDDELQKVVNIIRAAAVDYEAARNQLSLFTTGISTIAFPLRE